MPFRPRVMMMPPPRSSVPPIMYPVHPPPVSRVKSLVHPPPVARVNQDFLLNLLRGIPLPEGDLEILRQMVDRNTTRQKMMIPPPSSHTAPQKRPRIDEGT